MLLPASRRAGVVVTLALLALTLSGCVFGPEHPKDRIGHAAQDELDELGVRAGVEMFNDSEGFGSSYSILICAEVADDVEDRAAAEQVAEIVNALRDVTTTESDYVNAVQVRLVPESAGASPEELASWCRVQWPEHTIDLINVGSLFSDGDVRGPDFELMVPYAEVAILAEGATVETPTPTPTATATPAPAG